MKNKLFIIVLLGILITGCAPEKTAKAIQNPDKMKTNAVLTIVYDNTAYDKKLSSGWGFGCIVKTDKNNILFDTGGESQTLLANMQKIGIDPKIIDTVVLSHIHGDHTGGLGGFLEKNNNVKVYVPKSFPASFKAGVKDAGAQLTEVSGPVKIADSVYSTGEMGTLIKEQGLVIDTNKGIVLVTGCAHPGAAKMAKAAKEQLKENMHLVIGGFHRPQLSVVQEFRKLGVEKACPCHCTGESAIKAFEKEYKENYIQGGAGRIIKI